MKQKKDKLENSDWSCLQGLGEEGWEEYRRECDLPLGVSCIVLTFEDGNDGR